MNVEIFQQTWNPNCMTQKLQLPELPHPDHPGYNDYVMMYLAHKQHLRADEERVRLGITDQKETQLVRDFLDTIVIRKQLLELEPSRTVLRNIAYRYNQLEHLKVTDVNEWVRARLTSGQGVQIISDLDKTISITDSYQNHIVSSVAAENYMAHPANDEPSFIIALIRYWSHAIKHTPDELRRIGQKIEFRSGVQEFFARTKELQYPAVIASRNFHPVVQGVLDQFPENTFETFYAIKHDDITAMDKGTVIRFRALAHPEHNVIFIGDGTSDLPTITEEARQVVGCYFALEKSKFAAKLEEEDLPYYTYTDFTDITNTLKQLEIF